MSQRDSNGLGLPDNTGQLPLGVPISNEMLAGMTTSAGQVTIIIITNIKKLKCSTF